MDGRKGTPAQRHPPITTPAEQVFARLVRCTVPSAVQGYWRLAVSV
jgi:hypothetical protein